MSLDINQFCEELKNKYSQDDLSEWQRLEVAKRFVSEFLSDIINHSNNLMLNNMGK